MLALLEDLEDVASAEVDHTGMLIRLHFRTPESFATSLAAAEARLRNAEITINVLHGSLREEVERAVDRWYDRHTADELSQEEVSALKADLPAGEPPSLFDDID